MSLWLQLLVIGLIFCGCFAFAWYWLRYGFFEFVAVLCALSVMVGLFIVGIALIDPHKPLQTIPRRLT